MRRTRKYRLREYMTTNPEHELSRRDFLKLSASGIVLISVTRPDAVLAYQSNPFFSESSNFGRGKRQAEWRQAPLARASQMRVTQTDLGVRTNLAESIGSLLSRTGREFLEHVERKRDEMNNDALMGAWYMLSRGPLPALPALPGSMGFKAAYKTTSLGVSMVEHIEVMTGGHMSEDYARETQAEAAAEHAPAVEAAVKKSVKSNQNAFEERRSQRDLQNVNRQIGRELAGKSSRDIDREQYQRGTRDTWSNSRTA